MKDYLDNFKEAYPPEDFNGLLYLAAPYTHTDFQIRVEREEAITKEAARLMQAGYTVFSPVTHGHRIARVMPLAARRGHEMWMRQCKPILYTSTLVLVLSLEGWSESRGLKEELEIAEQEGIIVIYSHKMAARS